jgi:hypothetical protein
MSTPIPVATLTPTTIPNLQPGETGYAHSGGFNIALSKEVAPDRPTGRAAAHLHARFVDANGATLPGTRTIHHAMAHDTRSPHALYIASSHLGAYMLQALKNVLQDDAQATAVWQQVIQMAQADQKISPQDVLNAHLDIFAEFLGAEWSAVPLSQAIAAL